ncbi:MAG: hypothetical protein HKN15_03680 [Xanthomonadales bacterium]|nr:hypothetical protein [Xanthomonadales bacterium]
MKLLSMSLSTLLCNMFLLAASPAALAQDGEPEEAEKPAPSLSELAAAADLVALVRVLDTDYQYTRNFPSGGSAFLEVLIPYKVSRPLEDILEVYEEGLHEGECYFENPSVLEEGRRHLVFLRFHPQVEDQYQGLDQGCRLEMLVTADNGYALRYPLNGIEVSDDVQGLAQQMRYADGYAVFKFEDLPADERVWLEENGYLAREGEHYRYTHGIPVSEVRKLMGPEALTLDRSLK